MESAKGYYSSFFDRLSILSAIILLTYALVPLVDIPAINLNWRFLGIFLDINIDFSTYISILVPALAAVGTYWLIETHPDRKKEQYPFLHTILPAITAWTIGLPFTESPLTAERWIIFVMGGALLLTVFFAEFVVVDPTSDRHPIASGILKALSLTLYLLLAIATRSASLRLFLLLPALVIPAFLVLLRTFYLQSGGKWLTGWAAGISIILGQIVVALHYLPFSPLPFGLLLTAALYAMLEFALSQQQNEKPGKSIVGPVIIMAGFIALAFLV